jgi:GNAT superfamily N-acetyltransferase
MDLKLETISREDPQVLALYEAFVREADGPLGIENIDAEFASGPPKDVAPPNGVMLIARADGAPAGLGGVRYLDTDTAEVKSMYVAPEFRGLGLGRRILDELERIAIEHGCRASQLDTSDYLTSAMGLYRSAGYHEVPAYNDNAKANLWFERDLAGD